MSVTVFIAALCSVLTVLLPAESSAAEEPPAAEPDSALLKLFNEPSVRSQVLPDSTKVIRLIFLSTFSAPASVRAYLTPQGPRLRAAHLSGKVGYEIGTLAFQNDFPLAKKHWERILQLSSSPKARQPLAGVNKGDLDAALAGTDGATWILEVRDGKHYFYSPVGNPTMHLRWQQEGGAPEGVVLPDIEPFVTLCRYLLQFAPMDAATMN